MKPFKLTDKQQEAQQVLSSQATHLMLYGGSRSGKTFLHVRNIVFRALKAKDSRHAILRFRFNHLKAAVIHDTFPKVMRLCFPQVNYHLDKTDWFVRFDNGAEIWFGGLDDKERTEKILGNEYVTIYLNESSQIAWSTVGIVTTRLAQSVDMQIVGKGDIPMKPRMYYDCNPPSKAHWSYKLFILKQDPETKNKVNNPDNYAFVKMNPEDNLENLTEGYLDTLDSLSAKQRLRFKKGDFADATPNQLFSEEDIEKWRVKDGKIPDFVRVVVGNDPSGSGDVDNADNDAIGIMVGGLGTDGNVYLLEDCTVKAGPKTWGKITTDAYSRHAADVIVGEGNYGGAMVEHTIKTSDPRAYFKMVNATRGKAVRAEPFAALYEQGKIRHVGEFPELEDEMVAFSTVGYLGDDSPNRADAWFWVLAELFPGVVRVKQNKKDFKMQTRNII